MTKRTKIDIIVNDFLLSKLNPIQFANEYFNNLTANELNALVNYHKENLQDELLKNFYEEQLNNIPIEINEVTTNTQLKRLENFEILKQNAFNTRIDALNTLFKDVLPKYLYKISKNSNKTLKPNEFSGLNYQGKFEYIIKFHKTLKKNKYIKVEYDEFRKFFKKTFINNEKRILWLKPLNHLNYLIQEIVKSDKFQFQRNNYRDIIPLMFDYTEKKTNETKPLPKEKLSSNNKEVNNTSILDKALKHIL